MDHSAIRRIVDRGYTTADTRAAVDGTLAQIDAQLAGPLDAEAVIDALRMGHLLAVSVRTIGDHPAIDRWLTQLHHAVGRPVHDHRPRRVKPTRDLGGFLV